MLAEDHIILHVNDVHSVVWVVVSQILKDLQFDPCLIVVLFLVLDDLECDHLLPLVIEAPDGLAEWALAKELLYLVPVANVVANSHPVVALVVIIAVVELILLRALRFAPLALLTHVIDLGVVYDLLELILGQVLLCVLESNLWSCGFFNVSKTIDWRSSLQR